MNVELKSDLERRLRQEAQERELSAPELVEQVLTSYLDSLDNPPTTWVQTTQKLLPRVWPVEDFSDWCPPDAR